LLHADARLEKATALAYLAFDATRTSVTDVDFPIDIIVVNAHHQGLQQHRFELTDMAQAAQWWQERLASAVNDFPMDWCTSLFPDEATLTAMGVWAEPALSSPMPDQAMPQAVSPTN